MFISRQILFVFSLINISLFGATAVAQVHYVCDSGSDTNDGLSWSSPIRDFHEAMDRFNALDGGGRVLFCRGGTFPITRNHNIYNPNCSADSPCTLGSYGSRKLARPELQATSSYAALSFQDGGSADHDGGYIVKDLRLVSEGVTRFGVFLYNDVDDLTLKNLHIEGFEIGVYPAGTNPLNYGANPYNERLKLLDSVIVNNSSQGWLGSCNDCVIAGNLFQNNGYSHAIFNHNIYLGSPQNYPAFNITVRDNVLSQSAMFEGKCQGVSLVAHGLIMNLTIENNVIKEDADAVTPFCWGISVDPGYAKEESFSVLRILNNKVINMGGHAIGCASCDDVTIKSNTIIDRTDHLQAAIKVPIRPEDSVKEVDVQILDNSIYTDSPTAYAIDLGGLHPFAVTDNLMVIPETSIHGVCIQRSGANADTDIESNLCVLNPASELR